MADESIEIASGNLRLEGRLHGDGAALAAVALHPHPQYGGDMDNHVVVACCEAIVAGGGTTVRFNFRGAGLSDGAYDGGRGEADDARAALASIRERLPDAPLLLVGYSFGAMVAATVADEDIEGLVLISPPISVAVLPQIPVGLPVFVATGGRDQVSPGIKLRPLASGEVQVHVFDGVDHGWWPGIERLTPAIADFAASISTGTR